MIDLDAERVKFEAWRAQRGLSNRRDSEGRYITYGARREWETWQHCTAHAATGLTESQWSDLQSAVAQTLDAQIYPLVTAIAAMRKALEFYADPYNYQGPNQTATLYDLYTRAGGYRLDVTFDGGAKAREALTISSGSTLQNVKQTL